MHIFTTGRPLLFGSQFDTERSRNPLNELGRKCDFFTMMRHPVSRLVSAFYYCPEDHDQQLLLTRPLKVSGLPVARSVPSDISTRCAFRSIVCFSVFDESCGGNRTALALSMAAARLSSYHEDQSILGFALVLTILLYPHVSPLRFVTVVWEYPQRGTGKHASPGIRTKVHVE